MRGCRHTELPRFTRSAIGGQARGQLPGQRASVATGGLPTVEPPEKRRRLLATGSRAPTLANATPTASIDRQGVREAHSRAVQRNVCRNGCGINWRLRDKLADPAREVLVVLSVLGICCLFCTDKLDHKTRRTNLYFPTLRKPLQPLSLLAGLLFR